MTFDGNVVHISEEDRTRTTYTLKEYLGKLHYYTDVNPDNRQIKTDAMCDYRNLSYRFPDDKSWEEYYDTYEWFIQKQLVFFQVFEDCCPLGMIEDPILGIVVRKTISNAKDALSKCPNKTAVIMKKYWEENFGAPQYEKEVVHGVEEIELDGKKYLVDPKTNDLYDYMVYMETGEGEEVGIYVPKTYLLYKDIKPKLIDIFN